MTCLTLENIPAIVITTANIILPLLFSFLLQFEKYTAHTALLVDLGRSIMLRLTSLFIAFLTAYLAVQCDYAEGCISPQRRRRGPGAGTARCV